MNVEHIQSFLAVGRLGSFRYAARERGLSQPAVTRQVQALERGLRARLVVRRRSGCELTAEGRRFVVYAEAIVQLVSRAQNLLGRSEVAVGASSNIGTYLLPAMVRVFEDLHPDVSVSLTIGENEKIARQLEAGLIDVALAESWVDAPGFTACVWRNEPLVVIVHPGHPWSGRRAIPADWLLSEKLLGGEVKDGKIISEHFTSRLHV